MASDQRFFLTFVSANSSYVADRDSEHSSFLVNRIILSGQDFVLYRMPAEREPRLVMGPVVSLNEEFPFRHYHLPSGFLFHPFCPTQTCPSLLIKPDTACRGWELIEQETESLTHRRVTLSNIERKQQKAAPHADDFRRTYRIFRNQIDRRLFRSLYLSQAIEGLWADNTDEGTLFTHMLQEFPDEMVYLIYTRISGRWAGHTPRILMRGGSHRWESIAPSGSRHITYTPDGSGLVNSLLEVPSEEISGEPSALAREFIRLHEGFPRLYFTGIVGNLNIYGETSLFLNTSCLKVRPHGRAIFYGGAMMR